LSEKEIQEIYQRLNTDFNFVSDLRSKVLIVHLNLEHWIDKIIESLFGDSSLFRTFAFKVKILQSIGVFANNDELLGNIKLINNIRNRYAHNLLSADETDPDIRS